MSQVAILIILAAGQVDDSGWQSNTREVPVTTTRDAGRGTASPSIDRASFDALESDPSADNPTGNFDSQLGEQQRSDGFSGDVDVDFKNGFDLADESLGDADTRNRRFDPNSVTDSFDAMDHEAGSFWNKHDLLLNSPQPARDLETETQPQRFRRVDSWNVPIPRLPLNAATGTNGDLDFDQFGSGRSTNRGDRQNNARLDRDGYSVSDNDRYLPDRLRNPSRDLRQRDEGAFELNGDDSRDDELVPVRNTPANYEIPNWKAMPTGKAMNLVFGGKKANANNGEQNVAVGKRQGSLFASAKNMFWPFVFATLGLVASLAFNLYLGFIAWDIHGQYQDVVADLSELESREDEMPPSLLENRASQALSSRIDQPGSRRRSISI